MTNAKDNLICANCLSDHGFRLFMSEDKRLIECMACGYIDAAIRWEPIPPAPAIQPTTDLQAGDTKQPDSWRNPLHKDIDNDIVKDHSKHHNHATISGDIESSESTLLKGAGIHFSMGQVSGPSSSVTVIDYDSGAVIDISSIVSKVDLDMSPGILNGLNLRLIGSFTMNIDEASSRNPS